VNGIPIQIFILPVLALVFVAYFVMKNKKVMGGWEQTNAKFRLSEFAPRLGLSVVEGDPNFNLMLAATAMDSQASQAKETGMVGALKGVVTGEQSGTKNLHVVLRGAPNGRATEYVYLHKEELDVGLLVNKLTTTFECRFTVQVARPFSPFEIVLRKPGMAMNSPAEMSLPPRSLGDPLLDAKFIFSAADPKVAPTVAEALGPLANMPFFHVQAHHQAIHFVMTQFGSSAALASMEQVQYAFEQMAAAFEGRAAPGAVAS